MDETIVLRSEEINNAIIGKIVWWRGLQKQFNSSGSPADSTVE
jgi:hypothetical protein